MSYLPQALIDFPNQLITAGSMASTVLYTAQKPGLHRVAVYVEPVAISALAYVTVAMGWTSNGIARTKTYTALSLASLSNLIQDIFPVNCDVGTNITVSATVSGSAGSFAAHFAVKPPG